MGIAREDLAPKANDVLSRDVSLEELNTKVTGPANATSNAIAKFSGVTGKEIQNSGITIDASNNISGANTLTLATTTVAPLTVSSTSLVTNLNADLLDGKHASDFLLGEHNHTLDSLSNVTITSNATGEILKWNGTAWINNTLAEAGISATGHTHSYAPNAFSTIAVSGQSNVVADSTADTLTLVAGTNVTLTTNATNDSVTITSSHPDITAASSVNNSGRTYIQDITLDSDGHVTALSSATESVVDTNTTYSIKASSQTGGAGLDLDAGGSGSGTDTVIFKGGTNVTVSYTDANTITIASTDTNTDTLVTQTVTTTDSTYPILFTNTVNKTATSTDTARFGTGVKINPSTSTISATVFSGNLTGDVTGNVSGSSGSCTGNAATATKLATSRTISLTGDVTGSASFDGSANASITATVADDSHNHTIANVDSLQTTLDGKVPTGRTVTAGNGMSGGGALSGNITLTMGTPSSITSSSTNSVTSTSHTHAITGFSLDDHIHSDYIPFRANDISDLNSAIEDGIYSFYGSTNTPDGFSGYGEVYVSTRTSGAVSQIFITRVANETGKAYFRYSFSNVWYAWKCISVDGHTHVGGDITSAVANATTAASCSGNAATATKLATARTISLTGDVTGSASFDGSANASITATVADDSHNHTIANIDSLQTTLDGKAASSHTHAGTDVTSAVANATTAASCSGNAATATKLATARTISLTGDVTGSASFDGSANASITATVADDSHSHDTQYYKKAVAVPSGADLNDYTTAGFYFCSSTATASTMSNIPVGQAFSLRVYSAAGVVQYFHKYNSNLIYVRAMYSSVWTPWTLISMDGHTHGGGDITSAVANATTAASCSGNAATATKLATARTISLTGDVTGSASFDGSANASITATVANDSHTHIGGNITSAVANATTAAACSGNAATATKLATSRTISLTGDVTGSASFDGSDNASITATVADDSHNHTIANVDSLQTTLDGKVPTGRTVTAGNGMTGGGALSGNITLTMGTPSSITSSSTNSVTSTSHTHEVTSIDATKITGTIADARLSGTYSGFTHKIDGSNTVYTTPSSGSSNTLARTVYGLAEYRSNSGAQVGAIVFIAPNTTSTIMYQFEIAGMLYNQHIVSAQVQGYRTTGAWSALKKCSTGTVDVTVRFGVTPDGKNCLILGAVDTSWSYPHLSIIRAMFSHTNAGDAHCTGWTTAVVTDLSTYTNVTSAIEDSAMVGSITGNAATSTSTSQIATVPVYTGTTAPTLTTRVNVNGYLYATRVYNAVFNDYAECFNSDYHIEDIKYRIVEIRNNKVYPAIEESEAVIGVVSTTYGILLHGTEEDIQKGVKLPIGMAGTLMVDAENIVEEKDINRFVCSGIEGKARVIQKGEAYKYEGCIVGKVIGIDTATNQYKLLIMLK